MATAKDTGSKGSVKAKPKRNPIPTRPSAPAPAPSYSSAPIRSSAPATTTKKPGSASTGSKSGSASTGSKTSTASSTAANSYDKYQKEALKRENDAKRKAAQRYMTQAKNLQAQADALKLALSKKGFRHALDQQLRDITQVLRDQQELTRMGYRGRVGSLKGAARDNDKAEAQQSGINANNVLRERGSAIGEATVQGAGETDQLRAQLMSLRNWNANQTEVQRGYFDTLRSINSSLTDLTIDTQTSLANNEIQANADKEQLWTNFYNQKSEAYTQLGNTYGQQADYYAQAEEMKKGVTKIKTPAKPKAKDDDKGKGNLAAKPGTKTPAKSAGAKAEAGKGGGKGNLAAPKTTPRAAAVGGRNAHDSKAPAKLAGAKAEAGKGGGSPGKGGDKNKNKGKPNKTATLGGKANRLSLQAFKSSAEMEGKSWNNPGVSDAVMGWKGADAFEGTANTMSKIQAARTVSLGKKPEGATLRKW